MKLITSKTDLIAAIASIATRGKELDADIGIAAVSAMALHGKHGNTQYINDLLAAMPKGARSVALIAYIAKCGKVTWNEDIKQFEHNAQGEFNLELATDPEKSWVTYKPEQPFRALDLDKAIAKLIEKAKAASEGDDADKHNVDTKKLDKLVKLAGELGIEFKTK